MTVFHFVYTSKIGFLETECVEAKQPQINQTSANKMYQCYELFSDTNVTIYVTITVQLANQTIFLTSFLFYFCMKYVLLTNNLSTITCMTYIETPEGNVVILQNFFCSLGSHKLSLILFHKFTLSYAYSRQL